MCTKMHAHRIVTRMLRSSHNHTNFNPRNFSTPRLACPPLPLPHASRAGAPAPDNNKGGCAQQGWPKPATTTLKCTHKSLQEERQPSTTISMPQTAPPTAATLPARGQSPHGGSESIEVTQSWSHPNQSRPHTVTSTGYNGTAPKTIITAPPQRRRRSQTRSGPPLVPG